MLWPKRVKSVRRYLGSILGRIATLAVVGPMVETASRWGKTVKMARKSPMIPDKHGSYFSPMGGCIAVSFSRRVKSISCAIFSCARFTLPMSFSR
jgi:hypothetical protein